MTESCKKMGGAYSKPRGCRPIKSFRQDKGAGAKQCVLHELCCSRGRIQFTEMAETADRMEVSWSYSRPFRLEPIRC